MADDPPRQPIAIVGMECVFPGARDLESFWSNIVNRVDAISEIPPARWDPSRFGLPPVKAGTIDDLTDFDPLELGVLPAAVDEGDPEQFLVLRVVHRALRDAFVHGSPGDDDPRGTRWLSEGVGRRTELVIGRGGYMGHGIEHLHLRMEVIDQLVRAVEQLGRGMSAGDARELRRLLADAAPPLTAEAVSAALPNLTAGRAANRLDLMGASYTVDAACASALVAVGNVVHSLRDRRCDLGIAAAVHINQKPSIWAAFDTLGVLSKDGGSRPFDRSASGLVMGEGIGAVVLKRLADAERDGNRVYAVIRGVGVAGDGRATGLLTPNLEGEVLSLRRAYQDGGVDPDTIALVEGHGTATPVGDRTEIAALRQVFPDRPWPTVALGSVKSMIGHAMPAAGMAGLIKTALAVYHRVLPPTLNVQEPNSDLDGSAFYVNTETSPWITGQGTPRRAAVNAFGFGGINGHVVLEESVRRDSWTSSTPWGFELIPVTADSRSDLERKIGEWRAAIARNPPPRLRDVALTASRGYSTEAPVRLAIVASDLRDLEGKLGLAHGRVSDHAAGGWVDHDGVYFGEGAPPGKTAVVFPGIGFPGLAGGFTRRLGDLCIHFPVAGELIDRADTYLFNDETPYPLHCQLFPPPLLDEETHTRIEHELGWSARTPTAFVMSNLAGWAVLDQLGLRPDGMVGFSLGELVALIAAGAFETSMVDRAYLRRIQKMERSLELPPTESDTAWAMVAAPADTVETVLERTGGKVHLAMDVAPAQTFVAGDAGAVREVLAQLAESGIWSQELPQLPMLKPFFVVHTPAAKRIADRYWGYLADTLQHPPNLPVYSGSTGRPYTSNPRRLRRELLDSITGTVRIRDVVESLYGEGYRIFVQLGAGGKLLANIHNTLAPRPHTAVAIDLESRGGLEQLLHLLARLAALGVPFDPAGLFRHRTGSELSGDEAKERAGRTLSLEGPRLDAARAAESLRPFIGRGTERTDGGQSDRPTPPTSEDLPEVFDRLLTLQHEHEATERRMLEGVLDLQRGVLGLLEDDRRKPPGEAPARPRAGPVPLPEPSPFPMLGTVLRFEPGRGMESRLDLDLDRHRFLCDHLFINLPPELKPPEQRLPTLPLTFGLEIIAEAARTIEPTLGLIEIVGVEARRWISLDDAGSLSLKVIGRRSEADKVVVEVWPEGADRPALSGTAVFSDARPRPRPAPGPPALGRPSPYTSQQFYATGPLFHGPTFQVIRRLCEIGEDTASADVLVSDPAPWFGGKPSAAPILEPVLLDGLAQVAGYRAWLDGVLVLPVSLERLTIFEPLPPPGTTVRCFARLRRSDGRLVDIDVDASSDDGQPLLRLEGLRSWRVFCHSSLLELNHRPRDLEIAQRWRLPDGSSCFSVGVDDLGDLGPDWIARLYLEGGEWQAFRSHRRIDWLLGRIAAKDALRDGMRRGGDGARHPLELSLDNTAVGRPTVTMAPAAVAPAFSLAHIADQAVAVTCDEGAVGIDLVAVEERPRELVTTAFDDRERRYIGAAGGDAGVALHRAWAAKEAAAKAHGWGLDGMTRLKLTALGPDGAEVAATDGGQSAAVVTALRDGRVVAVARLRR